jgi:WD40 repeat protein
MSTSGRRVIWLILLPLLIVVVLALAGWWGIQSLISSFAGPAPVKYDTPTQLASVSVPQPANSLVWSADGAYLAAGICGSGTSDVYVVDAGKASVTNTVKVTGWVEALAFSPDSKYVAVGARQAAPAAAAPESAELVVFDVPAFTPKFTVKAGGPDRSFLELAWAPDGKALYAIDGPADNGGQAEVRRWAVPDFKDHPAIKTPQLGSYKSLAASPDGKTLAVADEPIAVGARWVRLFDLADGTERSSFKADHPMDRLAFTPDGKAVVIFAPGHLSWFAPTGRPEGSGSVRLALQPAGLAEQRSHYAVSPDGSVQARGYEKHRGFGDLGWDNRANEFGAFVEVTATAPAKTWTWRVGNAADGPAVAFSPDGTKIAGTVGSAGGASILIWAVPK